MRLPRRHVATIVLDPHLGPYGEVLPYAETNTVDGAALDDYGVPIARIDFKYGENERKMMTQIYQTAAAILKEARAEILPYDPTFMGMPGPFFTSCIWQKPFNALRFHPLPCGMLMLVAPLCADVCTRMSSRQ